MLGRVTGLRIHSMKMPKEEEYVCKRSQAAFMKQTHSRRCCYGVNYTAMFTVVFLQRPLLSMQRDPFKVKRCTEVLGVCLETVIYYKHWINKLELDTLYKMQNMEWHWQVIFHLKNKCVLYMFNLSFVFEVKNKISIVNMYILWIIF